MIKISIVDYGCGNLLSIKRALEKIGYESLITNKKEKILKSDFLILPGVGAFQNAMKLLNENDLVSVLNKFVLDKSKRLFGICLGMQILFTNSYEMGEHKGLDLIKGEVVSIKKKTNNKKLKIPHISWNKVFTTQSSINNKEKDFDYLELKYYFVHSFLALTDKSHHTLAYCNYQDVVIPAVIKYDNIMGCQFHPEKSGKNGLNFLKGVIQNWKAIK